MSPHLISYSELTVNLRDTTVALGNPRVDSSRADIPPRKQVVAPLKPRVMDAPRAKSQGRTLSSGTIPQSKVSRGSSMSDQPIAEDAAIIA